MNFTKILGEYLRFTRRERIAVSVLTVVILLLFLLPYFTGPGAAGTEEPADTSWITALKKLEKRERENAFKYRKDREYGPANEYMRRHTGNERTTNPKSPLFFFDPNTLSYNGWQQLGLREKTIRIILNYLSKGGRFRKPGDLQKIYGLSKSEFARLAPYIQITGTAVASQPDPPEKKEIFPVINDPKKIPLIDINRADTSAFISLPGIGSRLAARIVLFREKLGGFHSVEQVSETFGLPDSVFKKIRPYLVPGTSPVKKININTATEAELGAHPYIRFGLARPIIAYRNEKGPFLKLEDLMKVMAVSEEAFSRMAPYLTH